MKKFIRRFVANRGAVAGLAIFALVIVLAVFCSFWFESPWTMLGQPLLPPLQDPDFPLGTDMLGRDIAAGLAYGARVSLLVGIVSTLAAVVFGILVGSVAGFYGGRVDDVLMRFTEFFQTIPSFVFAIVLVAIFRPTIYSIVAAIAVMTTASALFNLFLGRPLPGDYELTKHFIAIAIFTFLPYCQATGANVTVDIFTEGMGPRAKSAMAVFSSLFAIAFALLLLRQMSLGFEDYVRYLETTATLGLPLWTAFPPILVSLVLLLAAAAITTIEALGVIRRPPAGPATAE